VANWLVLETMESKSCILNTGRKVAWREWGAGQPLIMLHGWSMSSVVFSEVANALAADYRILCPDLPGHGESDELPEMSLVGLAAAVVEWGQQLGLNSVALLGWSLGGQVALQIVAGSMLQVEKLLLISTTPCFCQGDDWKHGLPKTQVRALERNLGRAYEKTMGDFFNLQFVGEDLPKERYREILGIAVRPSKLPKPDTARLALQVLSQADLRSLLPEIKQPTLVMHGEFDQIIPVDAGVYLDNHLQNSQFHRMPLVGHAPFFSRLEETLNQWRRFLQ